MSRKALYTILSVGLIGTFFGHGAWAVGGKESFVGLLADSMDNVFGVEMSGTTAERIVRGIGVADIVVAAAFLFMLVGIWMGRGRLERFAHSTTAMVLLGWGILWGFTTAAARMTAAGQFFPEIWDWVERAPNFMIPAALLYMVFKARSEHVEAPLFVPEHFHERKSEPVS